MIQRNGAYMLYWLSVADLLFLKEQKTEEPLATGNTL